MMRRQLTWTMGGQSLRRTESGVLLARTASRVSRYPSCQDTLPVIRHGPSNRLSSRQRRVIGPCRTRLLLASLWPLHDQEKHCPFVEQRPLPYDLERRRPSRLLSRACHCKNWSLYEDHAKVYLRSLEN